MTHQEIEEREIVDAYLRRRLSDSEREAFEEHFFACDECFAQVRASEALQQGVRQAVESGLLPEAEDPAPWFAGWLRPAFAFGAAAAVVMLAVSGWLALVKLPAAKREAAAQRQLLERQGQRVVALEQQLAVNRPPPAAANAEANLPLVMLEASRATAANTVTVGAAAQHVVLWIELPPGRSGSYRLDIRTLSGQPVESIGGLARNPYGALAASIAAERLQAGTYRVRLFAEGGALTAEYRLEVRR